MKNPQAHRLRAFRIQLCNHLLLDCVLRQVAVRFRELCKFGFVVNVRIGNLKGTGSAGDVCLDIADASDFGQIASDRGGTATSVHVRYFQAHKRHGRIVVALHNGR